MNRFALLTFFRSLTRHKLYAGLNIGGLAVGFAVFLVLGLYVRFETSYERWLPSYQGIYLIEAKSDRTADQTAMQDSPVALFSAVQRDLPGTIGTRIANARATVLKDGTGYRQPIGLVDVDFAKVFALPTVAGNIHNAFESPSNVVLTESVARKYFSGANPLGKNLTVNYDGITHNYLVSAVLKDFPANTDFTIGMYARLVISENKEDASYPSMHRWNYFDPRTYVRFDSPAAARTFAARLPALVERHASTETPQGELGSKIRLSMQPIAAVHGEAVGQNLAVATLGIVGVLTLLIAVVNYVNLATARAGLRAREVAMRKVLGADRSTLARHFVGEAIATASIAGVIGLAIAELGLPLVNAASGLKLSIPYLGLTGILAQLVVLVLVVGTAAGIYPAIVLARLPAAAVLASARSPGGGRAGTYVREGLVVFQFAIAIAFIVGTMVLFAQTHHVHNADLGFSRKGLMLVPSLGNPSLDATQRDTIFRRLAALPRVEDATAAGGQPGGGTSVSRTTIPVPGVAGDGPAFRFFETTPGFFKVMNAKLLAGRTFDLAHPGDINANELPENAAGDRNLPTAIVVNRAALSVLRIPSPRAAIGRTFAGSHGPPLTIIGVIDDMRFDNPRAPIQPIMYDFEPRTKTGSVVILRFSGNPETLLAAARDIWQQQAPEVPFDAKTADQNLAGYYQRDDHTAHLFSIGAGLAVLIGCVGLWGLASFNTQRRVKEIGIRKTLGASSSAIVRLLVGQFLRPVLIANLFAWPLAFFAMRTWLAGFNDRIALSPLFFVAATVLALAIAVLTVLAQSLRAAGSAPAWALRHD